jgi:hypothetical protein
MVLDTQEFTPEQRRALGKVYRLILSWKSKSAEKKISDTAAGKDENDLTSQFQNIATTNREIAQ